MRSPLQVAIRLFRAAAVRPPLSLPKDIQLIRPSATPRRLSLAPLLSISRSPSLTMGLTR